MKVKEQQLKTSDKRLRGLFFRWAITEEHLLQEISFDKENLNFEWKNLLVSSGYEKKDGKYTVQFKWKKNKKRSNYYT